MRVKITMEIESGGSDVGMPIEVMGAEAVAYLLYQWGEVPVGKEPKELVEMAVIDAVHGTFQDSDGVSGWRVVESHVEVVE